MELSATLGSHHHLVSTNMNYVTFVRYKMCFEQQPYTQYLYETIFRTGSLATCTTFLFTIHLFTINFSGFGGLEVACWPLVPKFAGSNTAETVSDFSGRKNPQHAFFRKGNKAVFPMSQIYGM